MAITPSGGILDLMPTSRVIARLDIKRERLIKGVHLEGLRVIGDPNTFAQKYYNDGADEIFYIDSVASLYGRNNLSEIVEKTAENVFVPITVGGGIRSKSDVVKLLHSGADKVAINTAAVEDPRLILDLAMKFGSQCIVLSIQALRCEGGGWAVFTSNGRERTKLDLLDWVRQAIDLGAGEILLTSIDFEGTNKGYDLELLDFMSREFSVPIIISGGLGKPSDAVDALKKGADAIAVADVLHYGKFTIADLKDHIASKNFDVRR